MKQAALQWIPVPITVLLTRRKTMIKDRDEPIAELKLSIADLNFLIDSLEHSASRSQNKDQLELLYFLRGKKNKLINLMAAECVLEYKERYGS
jgi:hypothetical protein|tara:strand:- start:705 stop:983 length:279 start_codon:yes stop_codon:yes gene_type:complete